MRRIWRRGGWAALLVLSACGPAAGSVGEATGEAAALIGPEVTADESLLRTVPELSEGPGAVGSSGLSCPTDEGVGRGGRVRNLTSAVEFFVDRPAQFVMSPIEAVTRRMRLDLEWSFRFSDEFVGETEASEVWVDGIGEHLVVITDITIRAGSGREVGGSAAEPAADENDRLSDTSPRGRPTVEHLDVRLPWNAADPHGPFLLAASVTVVDGRISIVTSESICDVLYQSFAAARSQGRPARVTGMR